MHSLSTYPLKRPSIKGLTMFSVMLKMRFLSVKSGLLNRNNLKNNSMIIPFWICLPDCVN